MKEDERIIIIGNSGSGKTWLGNILSQRMELPLFHMDAIRWAQGGYGIRRSALDIQKDLEALKKQDQWILEGVFGKMAQECLPFSTLLIWLDLPWEECKRNLLSRGPQFDTYLDTYGKKQNALKELLNWASTHESREDNNSWGFFESLYNSFENKKVSLRSREEMTNFLNDELRDT